MAEKRKIIELDIDVDAIIAKSSQLKTDLDKAREAQAALKKSGDTSSDAYIQLAAKVSKLSSEYNMNQKQLVNLIAADDKFLTVNEKITLALDQENKSISEATKNNAELKKIRNELNAEDEEQLKLLQEINAKIDANTKFIKSNVSEQEQQTMGIGAYKEAVSEAIKESGLFGGQLSQLNDILKVGSKLFKPFKEDIAQTAEKMKNASAETEGMSMSQKALTIATNLGTGAMRIFSLALAATGIGLIIAAVALLIGYFKTFDPVVDKVEQGLAALGAVVRVVQQALASLFDSTQDSGKAFSELGDNMAKAARDAAKLKEAQQDLEDLQSSQEVTNARVAQQYDELILKSKNRTLTEQQRIAYLKKAEDLETKNYKTRAAQADTALKNAIESARQVGALSDEELARLERNTLAYGNYLKAKGKITQKELDDLKKAELGKIAIDAESTKRQEKNQNAQDKLAEDDKAKKDKAAQDAIEAERKKQQAIQDSLNEAVKKSKAEIDLFISQQGIRAKSLNESLKYEEQIRDKKLLLAQKEFDATKKTESDKLKLETDQNNIKNDFLRAQSDAVIANAQNELQVYLDANKSKLDANKFLTDELVAQEIDRLNKVSEAEAAFQTEKLVQGKISQEEYNAAIREIDNKFAEEKKALEAEKEQADLEKKAIDIENKIATDQLNSENEFAFRQAEIERNQEAELAAAKKNGADIELINQKYAAQKKALDKSVADYKINQELAIIQGIRGIVSDESALGKALAIADIAFTTVKNATQAFQQAAVFASNPVTAPLAVNASIQGGIIIASGATQSAKVAGLKLAKGEVDIYGPGTGTSDSIPAMLSKGESVITAEATSNNKELLRAINANAGIDFSSQFLPSSVVNMYSNTNNSQGIDYDLLAAKVAEANLNLPKPIVYTAITDINYGQEEYAQVVNGANV